MLMAQGNIEGLMGGVRQADPDKIGPHRIRGGGFQINRKGRGFLKSSNKA
jgi:hypothetical protein